MNRLLPAVLLLAAACSAGPDAERWDASRVLWERAPEVRSEPDARRRVDAARAKEALTVLDCHELALWRSEALALAAEETVRLQARYARAMATLFPQVTFGASVTRQDASGRQRQDAEYKLALHQPVFAGFREFHAMRQQSALRRAAEHGLRRARVLLYLDVAIAFHAVRQADRDAATTRQTLALAEERLQELEERQRAGITRRTEVLAQVAEVASARARLDELLGVRAVAWEGLRFLTGLEGERPLEDDAAETPDPGPAAAWIARALKHRRDLDARREEIIAGEEAVGAAKGARWPRAGLDAAYWLHRESAFDAGDWELTFGVDVPLVDRGTREAVREAESSVRSARLELERLGREVVLEINDAHAGVGTLRSALVSLEQALASAEEHHELVRAEYRLGIATNLEVLTALNTLERARLGRDRARTELKLASARLWTAAGLLPGEDTP